MPIDDEPKTTTIPPPPPAEHQGLPVKGYQAQPDWKVQLVNRNKVAEERVLQLLDQIRGLGADVDQRWLAIGRTHIEQGFMAINRAIFQPQRFMIGEERSELSMPAAGASESVMEKETVNQAIERVSSYVDMGKG